MSPDTDILAHDSVRSDTEARDADRTFARYLQEEDSSLAEELLGQFVAAYVNPILHQTVSSRMRSRGMEPYAQVEDVASEALVSFLLYVEGLRQGEQAPIENVGGFLHTLAARTCSDHFRRTHPAFHALRNKLRYLLETFPDLARWKDAPSGDWICGLAPWQRSERRPRSIDEDTVQMPGQTPTAEHPVHQLVRVFQHLGAPIRFDQLVLLMARRWNVHETLTEPDEELEPVDSASPVGMTLERRQWLTHLWDQILALNPNQRAALLLNLRDQDGGSAVLLFVITGIATLRQIAAVLEMSPDRFAELWPKLPLSDLDVGALLRFTRQQVINLRKCARERLARHMKISDRRKW